MYLSVSNSALLIWKDTDKVGRQQSRILYKILCNLGANLGSTTFGVKLIKSRSTPWKMIHSFIKYPRNHLITQFCCAKPSYKYIVIFYCIVALKCQERSMGGGSEKFCLSPNVKIGIFISLLWKIFYYDFSYIIFIMTLN